ncbi:MAG: hypothetical protein V2I27_10610 [Erythrobacter sp.]|jgi:hypothetical protein|nr:hypothetical protein [Erythrobacter sp.]
MNTRTFHSSRPDHWNSPRPVSDPCLRALAYGKVRPMEEPSWLERLFGRR